MQNETNVYPYEKYRKLRNRYRAAVHRNYRECQQMKDQLKNGLPNLEKFSVNQNKSSKMEDMKSFGKNSEYPMQKIENRNSGQMNTAAASFQTVCRFSSSDTLNFKGASQSINIEITTSYDAE